MWTGNVIIVCELCCSKSPCIDNGREEEGIGICYYTVFGKAEGSSLWSVHHTKNYGYVARQGRAISIGYALLCGRSSFWNPSFVVC